MAPQIEPQLLTVEPNYRHVLRARVALTSFIVAIGAIVIDQTLLRDTPFRGVLSIAVPLIAMPIVLVVPQRRYLRLRYRLTNQILQSVQGWLFQTDTLVPLVRVQHLDVTRGPLDKMFGTASLVVHTAGTHNSTVTVNGLAPERAAEIREIIRENVRSDFA
ncbi:PH domain-containing protein [Sphingomonas japonica]|uniref:YdbS-like PH domain-containing protein n=1 Tax=Sphingomonas japonica TaxID=511662 RepID=A0ABX0U5A0_9SPHN|nr:PH domain-containing protein [Sphingomonas japonica]NIJ25225.1 hypothetical protein [Sphingomonas japonica]